MKESTKANKYREGKVKSIQTWKSKGLEIENKEANSMSERGQSRWPRLVGVPGES